MADSDQLSRLARLVRYHILTSTTQAGSGHPTSSLSAADLMTGLLFGGTFRFDASQPDSPLNDRLIFSKGHASPLLYALWSVAGEVSEAELMTLRRFGSIFEGHPTVAFRFAEAATGSLGQGLSVGFGMALNAKYLDRLPSRTYVLLGDSEMTEGSQWETMELAVRYGLDNLVGIIDVNRLGQRGETLFGHDLSAYQRRVSAFGWETMMIDGHDIGAICAAYESALSVQGRPTMIIARTIKGKGVSFIEDRNGWHGKALTREQLADALGEIGPVDLSLRGAIAQPAAGAAARPQPKASDELSYRAGEAVATRRAYGNALCRLAPQYPDLVVLDAEVGNSTYAELFAAKYPDRFFEMYVAEQNMAGAAIGLSRRGKIPFVSTFAAFLTRAFDQIRMGRFSEANVKFAGSHAGVSIGEDGPSQMGLEDIAMFRTVMDSVVLYPSDAVSTERLVEAAALHRGMVYIRTTRSALPVIYGPEVEFPIGGSKIVRMSDHDVITVAAAGITLHEALAAWEMLRREGVHIRVIDLYSVKPLDAETLRRAGSVTNAIIIVEDHYPEGGIGEAVRTALADFDIPVHSLAVRGMPRSGTMEELLEYEAISAAAIVRRVKSLL